MKRSKIFILATVAAMFGVSLFSFSARAEELTKKLHTSPQRIINSTVFNDSSAPTSSTVDLAGGDYDKISFAVYSTSSTGTGTLSLALQISPNGGTNWIATGDTISVTTGTSTAYTITSDNLGVSPGTKARLVGTLTGSTTYYNLKVWATPSVD